MGAGWGGGEGGPRRRRRRESRTDWSRVEEPGRGEMRERGEVGQEKGKATDAGENAPPIGAGSGGLGEEGRQKEDER